MDASEYALQTAAESAPPEVARVANAVIGDSRTYHTWEVTHADLLLPVARQNSSRRLLTELRDAEVHLVHRRALFRYLREHEIRGEQRRRLFRLFHRTLDYHRAVLAEHQSFRLAESSRISADHIFDFMRDRNSMSLLDQYETLYGRFFELKCYVAMSRDRSMADLVRPLIAEAQEQLLRVRHRLAAEAPVVSGYGFDRQEALARSGRYQVLNYMAD